MFAIFKVNIFFLNGWKLSRGPCYNCTEDDEGHDVTARRKQYIIDTNDPEAFGTWSFEEEVKGIEKTLPIKNLTLKVNEEIKDVVLMVNKHERWELETSELNLLVNIDTTVKHGFDVM